MINLSVVIITFNEERNIARCIKSVQPVADEIVVIDSGSKDKTEEICRQYNCRFIFHPWEGYSQSKNFGNTQAKYDWIFSIDADEELSAELAQSIQQAKANDKLNYFKINRLTNYCGKWIKHGGWFPDVKIRIFDRRYARWEGLIHETLRIETLSAPELLQGLCYHYSYYTIAEHISQINKFTELSASVLFEKGKKAGLFKAIIRSVLKFSKDYFIRLGFLDGYYGFIICYLSAQATFIKYTKLKQLHLKKVVKQNC